MEETFDIVKFKMASHQQNITTIDESIKADNLELKKLTSNLTILDDAKNVLTILKNYKMESKKDFILKTINTAIQDVFDQGLRVDIEATSAASSGKINMKYDIVLYQNEIEMARNEKLLGNNGGGVLSFISILFKILVGYIYSDNKFFLFDESISQVSPLYRPRLAGFLRKFCEEYDFTIVLVSQTDDIDEFAHVGYLLSGDFDENGVPILKIDSTFGEYPTDKYTYVKIENFQSIVKLEFRYKGFTVIRGNNNIGKSASFRAVNSLLFNTFDAKDHPRKKRLRGAATKILFGKYDSTIQDNDHKIALSFKSNKVVYEFNDKTFSGKSLAFDKVKEKVESIGFKYVDLKETYKNFKGNLKDQTERLAMTSQYDGFYLVGNRTSETEKVFNFLFDSTDVANALANITLDILRDTNRLNELVENIRSGTKNLEKENIQYSIYVYKYYYLMIVEHLNICKEKDSLVHIKDNITNTIAYITSYMSIINGIYVLKTNTDEVTRLKNNHIKKSSDIYKELIEILNIKNILDEHIVHVSNYNIYLNKKIELDNTVKRYDSIIQILTDTNTYKYYNTMFKKYFSDLVNLDNLKNNKVVLKRDKIIQILEIESFLKDFKEKILLLKNSNDKLADYKDNQQRIQNNLSNNDKSCGISICPHCDGTGYLIG